MRPDLYGAPREPVQLARVGSPDSKALSRAPTSGGKPLPDKLRREMEASMGTDFSNVRVHQGPHVTELGAKAYAHGNDLHFAPGNYDPDSTRGRELIGHELAHVVQQRAGRVAVQAKDAPINMDSSLESEADRAGAAAASGERVSLSGASSEQTSVSQPAVQGVFEFLMRQLSKEVAREISLRIAKHGMEGVLEGLDGKIAAIICEAMSNNPALRALLRKAQFGTAVQAAAGRVAAPLAQSVRNAVLSALDAVKEQLPVEQREAFQQEVEKFKARLDETFGDSVVLEMISEALDVVTSTATTVASHVAIGKLLDATQAQLVRNAAAGAKDLAQEHLGDLTGTAREALEAAELVQKAIDSIPDVPLITRPMRRAVKGAADVAEDLMGTTTKRTANMTSIAAGRELLENASGEAVERAGELASEAATSSKAARAGEIAGYVLQVGLVLSELDKARSHTEAAIALLKPLAAMGATSVGGPIAGVAAPVAAEKILLKLEDQIEPWLVWSCENVQAIPVVGDVSTAAFQTAAATGGLINAGAAGILDTTGDLLENVAHLVGRAMGVVSTDSADAEQVEQGTTEVPDSFEDEDLIIDLTAHIENAIREHFDSLSESGSDSTKESTQAALTTAAQSALTTASAFPGLAPFAPTLGALPSMIGIPGLAMPGLLSVSRPSGLPTAMAAMGGAGKTSVTPTATPASKASSSAARSNGKGKERMTLEEEAAQAAREAAEDRATAEREAVGEMGMDWPVVPNHAVAEETSAAGVESLFPRVPTHELVTEEARAAEVESSFPPVPTHELVTEEARAAEVESSFPPVPTHELVTEEARAAEVESSFPPVPTHDIETEEARTAQVESLFPPVPTHAVDAEDPGLPGLVELLQLGAAGP